MAPLGREALGDLERQIRRKLRKHLRQVGFVHRKDGSIDPPAMDKETYRAMHSAQRAERLKDEAEFISDCLPNLGTYFADGSQVQPSAIRPVLQAIQSDSWESELFRLATSLWSIPVSRGYGRRIRYLVWDNFNGKLIGLLALGDPVFNLSARDQVVGWDVQARKTGLVNVMDAFVLGAVPPYNSLLCGKLIAALVRSTEIKKEFHHRYYRSEGVISQERKRAHLVMVTTTAALGRASLYNRLSLNGTKYFEPVGFTEGWGHFHIPHELYDDMRQYLRAINHPYAENYGFGCGPNWRLRATREVLRLIGENPDALRHQLKREVFVCRLAENAYEVLRGESRRPDFSTLQSVDEISDAARKRWIIPRAERRPEFRDWKSGDLNKLLMG